MNVFMKLALLTDEQAVRQVQRLAEARMRQSPSNEIPADLRDALAKQFDLGQIPSKSVPEPIAARYALVLAAQNDEKEVASVLGAAETESVLLTIGVLTAVVVILQTEIKTTKSADGTWTIEIHKPSASDSLIKSFVKSVLGLF